jgi:hypothetical protein
MIGARHLPTLFAAATALSLTGLCVLAAAGAPGGDPAASGSPAPAASSAPSAPPSPLIFPPQEIPIAFDHARHLKLGVGCDTCHAAAATSVSSADDLMPPEAACRGCHEIDRTQPFKIVDGAPPARCDACHTGWSGAPLPGGAGAPAEPPRVSVPRPNLKFNHQVHVSRGFGYELCHAAVSTKGLATRDDLPLMALCLGCHTGNASTAKQHLPTGRCGACHLTLPDGRLKVDLASGGALRAAVEGRLVPSGSLRGFDAHTPGFRTNHKAAGHDEAYCLTCHKQSECIDCHGGTVRPLDIHPSDYVSLHGVDARRNTPDCSSCHRNQTFCVGCHQRTGVASDPEGGVPGHQPNNPFGTGTQIKRFHPPGWVRDAGGGIIGTLGPGSHALQAKRNIASCASCHREETCLECHSADPTRSANIDPHGVGFAESARCRAMAARNRRACLKCHAVGAAELDCR